MTVNEIIIAGLFHDIGKFMQRADRNRSFLSPQSRGMEHCLCPMSKDNTYRTHIHVLYTNEFFESHMPYLPEGIDRSVAANLACYHHKPENEHQRLISTADRLSSGMERESEDEETRPSFRKVRLRSILSMLGKEEKDGETGARWSHVLSRLSPENVFPFEDAGKEDLTVEYEKLWEEFIHVWYENRVRDPLGFMNRSLSILEHFTWCIPSATNSLPDISLYDHAKTTAAIAACLYLSGNAENPFLFVAGDFTGIQKYIFDIKREDGGEGGGYAKRLRARSFYVTLLSEGVSFRILKELGLPLSQRIMYAGGKFQLLLPNTEKTLEKICSVNTEIDSWLREKTGGDIRFSLAYMEGSCDDLEKYPETNERILELLRAEKNRPYSSILQSSGGWVEELFLGDEIHKTDGEEVCATCGKRPGKKRYDEGGGYVCELCGFDLSFGRKLPASSLLIFRDSDSPGAHEIVPGVFAELADECPTAALDSVFLVESMSGGIDVPPEIPSVARPIAHYIPRKGDRPMTFEEIAAEADGASRIAYLKGDVDNLGGLFHQGFKRSTGGREDSRERGGADNDEPTGDGRSMRNIFSISRAATLSRTLEAFFSGYMEYLIKKEERFRTIYTVYAGGDDFLCLGPWNVMVDFAHRLRTDFRRFACNNPNLTMSMGIAVVGDHTPVLEAVEKVDGCLDVSKSATADFPVPARLHGDGGGGVPKKDRITLFETCIPWRDFDRAYERALKVAGWLGDGETLTTSHVWRLKNYAEMYRRWIVEKNVRFLEYIPLLAYDMRRNWNWKEPTNAQEEAAEWAGSLSVKPDAEDMRTLKFICEYALLRNR